MLSRLVTCQNMTMAEFAEKLKNIASGYIHSPVVDATGLEGGYDFTLSFSAVGLTRAFQAEPAGLAAPVRHRRPTQAPWHRTPQERSRCLRPSRNSWD